MVVGSVVSFCLSKGYMWYEFFLNSDWVLLVKGCGGGVVPGSGEVEGWCSEPKGQCQGGW